MRIPSTAMKMTAVMARTRMERLRIDSAGGETGSKIDRFGTDVSELASRQGIMTIAPVQLIVRHAGLRQVSRVRRQQRPVRCRPQELCGLPPPGRLRPPRCQG